MHGHLCPLVMEHAKVEGQRTAEWWDERYAYSAHCTFLLVVPRQHSVSAIRLHMEREDRPQTPNTPREATSITHNQARRLQAIIRK